MDEVRRIMIRTGIEIGKETRRAIYNLSAEERIRVKKSLLKSGIDDYSYNVDVIGEEIGIRYLEGVSKKLGGRVELVIDPNKNESYSIGMGENCLYVYMDSVDGTKKVSGLGNDVKNKKYRIANGGNWATGIAFSDFTDKSLEELTIGDFKTSVIVDGNPPINRTYPSIVFATSLDDGVLEARESRNGIFVPVYTTSNKNLEDTMVGFEAFQAFDKNSSTVDNEKLAINLFKTLIDRNNGGAFDLIREYGTLSSIQRNMLGWRGKSMWIESQGGAFVTINENLPNLIPVTPIIEEAGGVVLDFNGDPVREKRILRKRLNIIYAANETLAEKILKHVNKASERKAV